MAFQPFNYANISPLQRDPLGSLLKGGTAGFKLAQEKQAQDLINKLRQTELEYKPQELAQTQLLREAQLMDAQTRAQRSKLEAMQMKKLSDLLKGEKNTPETMDMEEEITVPYRSGIGPERSTYNDSVPNQVAGKYKSYSKNEINDKKLIGDNSAPTIITQGVPGMEKIDNVWKEHPEMRGLIKSLYNLSGSQKTMESPQTGQVFLQTTLPSGQTEITAARVGRQPEEIAYTKGLKSQEGRNIANMKKETSTAIKEFDGNLENLDYMMDIVNQNSEAFDVIGPVNSVLTRLIGNSKAGDILGQLQTSTGNIMMNAAKNISGAFTGRDQTFVKNMKPNPDDPAPVFMGKLRGMMTLNKLARKRMDTYYSLLDKGMNPREALNLAKENTNFNDVKDDVNKNLAQATARLDLLKRGIRMPIIKNQEQFKQFLVSLPRGQQQLVLNKLKEAGRRRYI